MEQLPVLYKTFPDATFVITHRDPVGSIRSAITMGLYAARILRKRIDPEEQSGYWIDRYRRLLERCVRDRDVLRSEEHTSELQSLMRISYAVFCLKKTINKATSYL